MHEIQQPSSADPAVVESITRTLRQAAAAVGRDDVDGVVAMFADEDSTLLFDYLRPGVTTLEQLRATARELLDAGDVACTYPQVSVRQLTEDVAISLADCHVEMAAADGSVSVVDSRVTDVWLRNADGRWLAVHEHGSVPVDVATGTAVLDALSRRDTPHP